MKVAIVYDRVNKWGGAERVLLALNELFPNAPLYTAVYSPQKAPWAKVFPRVIPTFLNKIPCFRDKHELLGTFTPIAFETLDLTRFNLVISVTSEAAKGVIVKPPAIHICYCLTPTRYLWSGYDIYFRNPVLRFISKPAVSYLKRWDKIAAQRPDVLVGISTAVQKRIRKYYGRESELIYPPVDIERFKIPNGPEALVGRRQESRFPTGQAPPQRGSSPGGRPSWAGGKNQDSQRARLRPKGARAPVGGPRGPEARSKNRKKDFFLVVSRFVPYKRVDLAIEAFNELGFPLVIVGSGSQEEDLKSQAKANIKFVGELTDERLAEYYRRCAALVFPQEEDFGLVAVEAQAAGAPVIAYRAGGALDTVISPSTGASTDSSALSSLPKGLSRTSSESATGVFFGKQDKNSLIKAVKKFKRMRFDRKVLVKNAEKFSKERFKKEFIKLVQDVKK